MKSSGDLPRGMYCSGETSTDKKTATWKLENNTDTAILGGAAQSFGAIYHETDETDPSTYVRDSSVRDGVYGGVSTAVAQALAKHGYVLAGTSALITKSVNSPISILRHDIEDPTGLAAFYALFQIVTIGDAVASFGGDSTKMQADALSCTSDIIDGGPGKAALSCAQAFVEVATNAAKLHAPSGSTLLKDLEFAGKLLGKIAWGIVADQYLAGLVASLPDIAPTAVALSYVSAPTPLPGPGSGSGVDPGTIGPAGGDGRFMARTPDKHGFLYNPTTHSFDSIKDGNTFLCYATRYVVIDLVALNADGTLNFDPPIPVSHTDADPCLSTPWITWDYSPPPAGNTPFNVILRGTEDDGPPVSSWLINSSGEIQTIPDGGVYECLTFSNPVIWNVPFDKIQAWQPVGTAPASCG